MKKQNTIIIIILLLLAGLGFYLVSSSMESQQSAATSPTESLTGSNEAQMADEEMEKAKVTMPETATEYTLTESAVSFIAQKRFLQKEDAVVTGTTDQVSGSGWYDEASSSFYLTAELDFADFETDSSQRDSDILKLFDTTELKVMVLAEDFEEIALGQAFEVDLPVTLTINNVERSEVFTVSGTVTEAGFSATGSTKILMSDFDVNPPSLANVFTVDDEIELTFDVSGEAKASAMMEETDEQDTMMDAADDSDSMVQ